MRGTILVGVFLAALGGCSGEYILSVPDHVAPAGGEAPMVARLGRSEFWRLVMPAERAGIEFRVDGAAKRLAFTDEAGYASTLVPAPEAPGRYALTVRHQDTEGDVVEAEGVVFVWDAGRPAVAVDLDALPTGEDAAPAREALARLAGKANVLYMVRRSSSRQRGAHDLLAAGGYPDGPVMLWQRAGWQWGRGWLGLPTVVRASETASPLPLLRRMFPQLRIGICTSAGAADAFTRAGLRCLMPAGPEAPSENVTRVDGWGNIHLGPS